MKQAQCLINRFSVDWVSGRLGLRRGRIARTAQAVKRVRGWGWRRRPAGTCASSATSHISPDPELPLLLHPAMQKGSNAALERMQKKKTGPEKLACDFRSS